VTDEGIWGNEVLTDTQCCGVSTLKRIDRDVFEQPNVRDIIFLEGINDIGCSETAFALCTGSTPAITAAKVIAGYQQVIADAHQHHMRIFGATLTPFENSEEYAPAYWTPAKEQIREMVNAWIRQPGHFDGVIDFARATPIRRTRRSSTRSMTGRPPAPQRPGLSGDGRRHQTSVRCCELTAHAGHATGC